MNNHIAKRHNLKWSVNELLKLHREYELLEWSIQDIANAHQRTIHSILYKLESEGLIDSWDQAIGFDLEYYKDNFNETKTNSYTEVESPKMNDKSVDYDTYYIDEKNIDIDIDEEDDDYIDEDDDYVFEENEDEDDSDEEEFEDCYEEEFYVLDNKINKMEFRLSKLENDITDIKHILSAFIKKPQKRTPLREQF